MTRSIGLVVFPGFQALDLAAGTVFELASGLVPEAAYTIALISAGGSSIESSFGARVDSAPCRSFGWMTRHRRLVRDYETWIATFEIMIDMAMGGSMIRRLAHPCLSSRL